MKFKAVIFKKVILPDDIGFLKVLAENLRVLDKVEIQGQGFDDVLVGLNFSVKNSQEAYLGFVQGQVVCIFGVSKAYYDNLGYPTWFLATNKIFEFKKEFLYYTKIKLKQWLERYGCLHNYVLQDNEQSIRWLKWLGARFLTCHNFANGKKALLFILKGDD